MGFRRFSGISVAIAFLLLLVTDIGCTFAPTVPVQQMLQYRALIDLTGLASTCHVDTVRVTGSPPLMWDRLGTQKTSLFTHEQWRSPSMTSAVGVIYARLPLPLSADALRWFAKREYQKRLPTTRSSTTQPAVNRDALTEWRDFLGRPWFDGENSKYHVRGFIVVSGLDAWFVYTGYRIDKPFNASEQAIAQRSANTFVPAKGS